MSSTDFKLIFEAAPGACMVIGPDAHFTIVAANDAYLQATMTIREEIIGRPVFEVFPDNPEEPNSVGAGNLRASLARVMASKAPETMPVQRYDIRQPDSDGGGFVERHWRPKNIPVIGFDGNVAYIIHTVEDVTRLQQLRQAEIAAREVQQELRTALKERSNALRDARARLAAASSAPEVGTWILDLEHQTIEADSNLNRLFGIEALKGEPIPMSKYFEAIHPEDRAHVAQAVDEATQKGGEYRAEYRIIGQDGSIHWILARGTVELDYQGRAVRMPGVILDTTASREAESQRLSAEQRYRLLVENIQDYAIFAVDDSGIITSWNAGAQNLLGYTEEEIIGRSGDIIFVPEDRAKNVPRKEIETAMREGRAVDERWHLRKDGSRFFASGLMSALLDDNGERIGLVKIMRDITDRQRIEDERKRALEEEIASRNEAERIGRLKDEFLATLSHELRTPLNAILGWAEILDRGNMRRDSLAQAIDIIKRNARAQAQLIDDLLDMNRIIAGKIHIEPEALDMDEIINTAMKSIEHAAAAKGMVVTKKISDNTPKAWVDPYRIQQILWNLLSNAVKFSTHGGHIHVHAEAAGEFVEVEVSDTGKGIAPEFLPHIFERFMQGDSTTTRVHGGLGLGLSIVKSLVEIHGGSISASSKGVGKGATFKVRLPGSKAVGEPRGRVFRPATSPDRQANEKRTPLKGITALIVDDEQDSRNMIEIILRESGAKVITAETADQALEFLERASPDVLISDIGMPNKDGYDLIRTVRETRQASVPAIAVTAFARPEDRERALRFGYQAHVSKPIHPDKLLDTVVEVVRLQEAGETSRRAH